LYSEPNILFFDLLRMMPAFTVKGVTSIPAALARSIASRESVPSALH
jgi:hypothetical protein